jgi:hypothetical protein
MTVFIRILAVLILLSLTGCGVALEDVTSPPAHIVRVYPECAVISGVLLDFAGLQHTGGPYWYGTFTGELVGSRVDGAACYQAFELEPCSKEIGWCP